MALNFPGVPSNEMPRSRARTVFGRASTFGAAGIGSRAEASSRSKSRSPQRDWGNRIRLINEFYTSSATTRTSWLLPSFANRGIGRSVLWFQCERSELILGEKRPRAFAFLPHDRGPILGCRIEGVGIHELSVRVIEGEIDGEGGFVECAVTDYFRGAPAKDIEPMQDVARHFVIEPDKSHRFVLRRGRDIEVMQLEKLMIEHPADAHGVFGGAAVAKFSNNTPVADQFIQQRILELDVTSVRGSWGLRAHRDSEEREGNEQGKMLHNRDNDRLSSFARCHKR